MADNRMACRVVIWLSVGFTMNRYLCIKQNSLDTKISRQMAYKRTACRMVGLAVCWFHNEPVPVNQTKKSIRGQIHRGHKTDG
jgi:hypothetical protein